MVITILVLCAAVVILAGCLAFSLQANQQVSDRLELAEEARRNAERAAWHAGEVLYAAEQQRGRDEI
jgi:hypothetical protein